MTIGCLWLQVFSAHSVELPQWIRLSQEMSPLHVASRTGSMEICTLLLEYGANVDARTGDGCVRPDRKRCLSSKVDSLVH